MKYSERSQKVVGKGLISLGVCGFKVATVGKVKKMHI